MRINPAVLSLIVVSAWLPLGAGAAVAAEQSAQSVHCSQSASAEKLTGAKRTAFVGSCMKGPLAAKTSTAPTASSKEAQAVTKPSGVDRATRTRQCAVEADHKGLAGKNRRAYQLSCLATAGPVSEGETGVQEPHPANGIKGIGVNNYKPSATTAKSIPQP